MSHKTTVTWKQDMAFDVDLQGHTIPIDADPQFGGKDYGPTPKPLVLSALGGCTGMDVVALMKKMRVKWDSFKLDIEGDLTEDHPKHYNKIRVVYTFTGNELDKDKIEKAVKMSQEKYCGVAEILKKAADIEYEIRLNP
ncbi:MAG: OsmC family protein [Spirochaetia bacterium]